MYYHTIFLKRNHIQSQLTFIKLGIIFKVHVIRLGIVVHTHSTRARRISSSRPVWAIRQDHILVFCLFLIHVYRYNFPRGIATWCLVLNGILNRLVLLIAHMFPFHCIFIPTIIQFWHSISWQNFPFETF
jgi:ABC-type xylose transport system permease subunit